MRSALLAPLLNLSRAEVLFAVASCSLYPVARLALDWAIFEPLSRRVVLPSNLRSHGSQQLPDKLLSKVVKLRESLWKLLAYASLIALELVVLHQSDWAWGRWTFWHDWPHQPVTVLMRALFGLQVGYYAATIYMLAYWEVPRKDFVAMQTHHVATLVMVAFSYVHRYFRPAIATMLLHDINDVIMELAKSLNYAKFHTLSNLCLACFVAAWVALRIYSFPRFILSSTLWESERVLGFKPPAYYLINSGLCLLYCLHIYWFTMILRVAYIAVTTGKAKDVREDGDDDDF